MFTDTHIVYIWLICYASLLATYFGTGVLVLYLNKKLKLKKIQNKPESRKRSDDIKQSLQSLASISFLLALGIYFAAQKDYVLKDGYTFFNTVIMFIISMILYDTWFYWAHRLMHTRFLMRHVHGLHHRSRVPSVWSNNSETLIDNLFSSTFWVLAGLFLPIPPLVLLAHKIFDQVTGMMGHSGYEYAGPSSRHPSPLVSVTFHDQHHEHYRCNYSTHFSIWDRLMGTLRDDYDQEFENKLNGRQE